ncbi:MAG: hypothetical protein HYR60_11275, partial [Acidobacteria bacterium]|nr:hypothetical protein [Acidobacteriota bacterium]
VLAAAMVYQVGQCLLVTNQNLYQLARYGAAGVWSDALYGLSAEIDQVHASQVVVIDWGMLNGIVTLHRGRLPVYTLSDDFIWQNFNADQRNYYRDYLDRGVWIGHTPKYRLFPAVNDRVVQSTEEAGYRKEPIKTVQDRNGREVFEMFRFVRRQ